MSASEPPELREEDAPAEPFALFARWYEQAESSGLVDPTLMTLATATRDVAPSARVVLLRGYDGRGFVFYTNYASRKGRELAENPRAALVMYWQPLHRQVRVEGGVERVTVAESDAYFRSRPHGHQLGALVSDQSEVITSREFLEGRLRELVSRYTAGVEVPRPEHWGGYRVVPSLVEFWQNRDNRLHDRLRYRRDGDAWVLERLAP